MHEMSLASMHDLLAKVSRNQGRRQTRKRIARDGEYWEIPFRNPFQNPS